MLKQISWRVRVFAGLLLACTHVLAQGQPEQGTSATSSQTVDPQNEGCGLKKLGQYLKDLGHDQAGIWTSPLRIKPHDAVWLVPFVGVTGTAFAYDEDALRQVGTTNKSLIDKSETLSEFGSPYATFGEAGVLYLFGALKHNDHLLENGLLLRTSRVTWYFRRLIGLTTRTACRWCSLQGASKC